MIIVAFAYGQITVYLDAHVLKLVLLGLNKKFIVSTFVIFGLLSSFLIYLKELEEKLIHFQDALQEMESEALSKEENTSVIHNQYLVVGSPRTWDKIDFNDILYIEADRNHQIIYTLEKKYLACNTTLSDLENLLPKDQFIRISRSLIIAKKKVYRKDGSH